MPTQPTPPTFDIGSVWPSLRGMVVDDLLNQNPVPEVTQISGSASSMAVDSPTVDVGFESRLTGEAIWWGDEVRGSEPEVAVGGSAAGIPIPSIGDIGADSSMRDFMEFQRRQASRTTGRVQWQSTQATEAPRVRRTRPTPSFAIPYDQGIPNEQEDNEMRTVGQVFGRNPDVATVTPHPLIMGVHRVGVEIEVERFTNRRARLNYWNMVSDGSLRNNGQEFTFRGPLGGKDAFDAIAEIDTLLYTTKPDLNIRCSTHVHVDVRDMTVPQLKRLILAYAFYESFLFNQSGRYRMKSNFCMPLCVAEGLTNILTTNWGHSDDDFLFQVTERWDKYSAINLIPMRSYGSVEFRIAEGKSSKGQLLRLVNRFLALKELAIASDITDREFLNKLRDTDYRSVFQKGLSRQVVFTEEDFNTGWVIANDIATLGKMR